MAITKSKCKICRRLNAKLFLKGERCSSSKCAMVKKPYPPGQKKKRKPDPVSEYNRGLREKQKLRNWYNLRESQFKKYVKKALSEKEAAEDPVAFLIKELETRLDNVIFRLGFSNSRIQAKKLVSHGYFLINGRSVDIPSLQVSKGDVISVKTQKLSKGVFKNIQTLMKKENVPNWLEIDEKKFEGKVKGIPTIEESASPAEISIIFEYYSK
ncbi:30S ribosomal protein S4 [Candidatus Parcubacteria bacterium A4]|nr:MAG: 30S ribosomal protein S4 [Candidatus Parcubacteria bacterium A4]